MTVAQSITDIRTAIKEGLLLDEHDVKALLRAYETAVSRVRELETMLGKGQPYSEEYVGGLESRLRVVEEVYNKVVTAGIMEALEIIDYGSLNQKNVWLSIFWQAIRAAKEG